MIKMHNVTKIYEDTDATVFSNLNINIDDGEFILLTGESGCGKTTFIKLLLKETESSSGEVFVGDDRLTDMSKKEVPYYRRNIGVIFQEYRLISDMTVYQNIEIARIAAGGAKKESRKIVAAVMSMLGIADLHKRYPKELSGGQTQRVCLARALVNNPKLLMADEPTRNLDPQASVELMKLFELVHRQGTTVIVATHDKSSAKGLPYREICLN